MKRPANTKTVSKVEFLDYVRIPKVGLRKEAVLGDASGVFAPIEDMWETGGKVFITSNKQTIAVPLNNVRQLSYLEE